MVERTGLSVALHVHTLPVFLSINNPCRGHTGAYVQVTSFSVTEDIVQPGCNFTQLVNKSPVFTAVF
jgi:hypothetical protein